MKNSTLQNDSRIWSDTIYVTLENRQRNGVYCLWILICGIIVLKYTQLYTDGCDKFGVVAISGKQGRKIGLESAKTEISLWLFFIT